MSADTSVVEALSLLQPYEVPSVNKIRIGNQQADGGYVMIDRLRPGQKVLSYGISTEYAFDEELAGRGLQVYMYDHTVPHPKNLPQNCIFTKEGVGPVSDPQNSLNTIQAHIEANGLTDDDMILKMDVEGAEWDVLAEIDGNVLCRFEQCLFEFHGLIQLGVPAYRAKFARVLSKLLDNFVLVHVHPNNNAKMASVSGFPMISLLEVSFLRKDIAPRAEWRTFLPTELDRPNISKDDYVMSFFPFLPPGLSKHEIEAGLKAAAKNAQYKGRPALSYEPQPVDVRGRNIAEGSKCTQSSLSQYSKGGDEAGNALRKKKNGRFAFHTADEESPWWKIDFGQVLEWDELICFNRLDAASDRARNMIVEISDDDHRWTVIHQSDEVFGGADGRPLRVTRPGSASRLIRLRLPGLVALHLDGVEVYKW